MDEKNIRDFYDATAEAYATGFINELDHKPFDRHLLRRFSEENRDKGPMADLGCGPGQTTHYLFNLGVKDIVGIDLSPKMVHQATSHFPSIKFETGNILTLDKPDNEFGALVAFYAIVHFRNKELAQFFSEAHRILKTGGQLLVSFHIGDDVKTVDELFGVKASADFYFHQVETIYDLLVAQGFTPLDTMTRYPYTEEFPSRRAYILVMK
jgi:SAM-dependent methyltransferase